MRRGLHVTSPTLRRRHPAQRVRARKGSLSTKQTRNGRFDGAKVRLGIAIARCPEVSCAAVGGQGAPAHRRARPCPLDLV